MEARILLVPNHFTCVVLSDIYSCSYVTRIDAFFVASMFIFSPCFLLSSLLYSHTLTERDDISISSEIRI